MKPNFSPRVLQSSYLNAEAHVDGRWQVGASPSEDLSSAQYVFVWRRLPEQNINFVRMASQIELPSGGASENTAEVYDHLLDNGKKSSKNEPGLLQRIMLRVDEQVSVKLLLKVWGPRLEFFIRCMLVTIFLEDSVGMASHFSEQVGQFGSSSFGVVAVTLGLLVQSIASLGLLAKPSLGHVWCPLLIGWEVLQPALYGQLTNFELVCGSLSIVGGLCLLMAHLQKESDSGEGKSSAQREIDTFRVESTELAGRLLLPGVMDYLSKFSGSVVSAALLVILTIGCLLIAVGLRSRTVALGLAILNIAFVCYEHPIWSFISYGGGEWKVNDAKMWMPTVSLADSADLQIDPWQVYDIHKYYFFLGLSTSGALLLLTHYGPGKMALQQNELVLPTVSRAQD
ncbi:hypothetical protein THAOC_06914 [Thalassiosira oceanica]|uniref:Surfeit locus protein 4 n=1 Tax=Thalassiosira oceanica TaxID=159749 RepID=K0TL82_THAOC|nr:hypothetical protein THAOC_06914 [Thalassiosira oceanica]|eukprot:EJK71622.1 hypothetical protein THAOC_06914 [Thalassiosira oceanica]